MIASVAGVRVVAGTVGGRRLAAPPGRNTRPTGDRVREAVFAALGSLGWVEGATVIDLYAGSGALGIEALSRGAVHATFVERDRAALEALRSNLAHTDLAARATVVAGSVESHLARAGREGRRWDLGLLDPPYGSVSLPELLGRLPAGTAVVEAGASGPAWVDEVEGWEVVRSRRYGAAAVTLLSRI